tara:strand:+ start:1557 stop:2057 length:501 start_codon:yes stop_codon:yes gene_type:complete
MSGTAFGGSVTRVTTTQELPLGFQVTVPDGDNGVQLWTYVNNDSSTAFAAGDICQRDPSEHTDRPMFGVEQVPSGTAVFAMSIVGVAQHAIAAGSYGFILTKGKGLARTGTEDMTADTLFSSGGSTDGSCLIYADGTIGAIEVGMSLEAKAGDPATFAAYINCLGA